MGILKQTLTWHDGNEPSQQGDKLLICKSGDDVFTRSSELPLNGKYAWYDVIAWAYIDINDIKTALANANVDRSWLEFLHKNATNLKKI